MQRWKSHTRSIFRAPEYADSAAGENSTPKSLHQITTEPHEDTSVPAGISQFRLPMFPSSLPPTGPNPLPTRPLLDVMSLIGPKKRL